MRAEILTFLLSLVVFNGLAQSVDSLSIYGDKMLNEKEEEFRLIAADRFGFHLDACVKAGVHLIENPSYSVIYAPDKSFRVITWAVKRDVGTFSYFGRFQSLKKGSTIYLTLIDARESIANPAFHAGGAEKWYGCMYYAIAKYGKKNPVYALLGWDGNNTLSNKKVIEIIRFNDDKLVFGKSMFYGMKKVQSRVIFEYMEDVAMSLRLDEKNDKIIFDHLTPIRANLEGQYAFYVPDFTYDSFRFHKGKFILEKNIDARNKDQNLGNPKKAGKKFPVTE